MSVSGGMNGAALAMQRGEGWMRGMSRGVRGWERSPWPYQPRSRLMDTWHGRRGVDGVSAEVKEKGGGSYNLRRRTAMEPRGGVCPPGLLAAAAAAAVQLIQCVQLVIGA